jgi:NAD(P)-dependent dehydrogenase (short-subunit alcohol dehydrogenase family)
MQSTRKRFEAKSILVTGGSRGLGAEIVRAFVREGARVAFTFAKDQASADALLAELGDKVMGEKVQVTDEDATDAFIRKVEAAFGPLDILVNNAGITQNLPLALLEADDFDKVMSVNVKGTYLTSRCALRSMIRRKKGLIMNIGSLAGERMIEAPIHYCASKAAIRGLTQAMAKEVARHNVRVLNLAPGLLEDGLGKNLPEHRLTDYLKHCALGRVGTFDEIAKACVFFASEDASYVSGETLLIDGGV